MRNESSLVFSGIAPHPPVMVPEVGHESARQVRQSIEAMAELTRRAIDSGAETVVLVSPHAPLEADAFTAYPGPHLQGSFRNFRSPQTVVEAQLDEELLDAITAFAAVEHLVVHQMEDTPLDHGTAVPLYFLQRNGWQGRVVALGYTFLSNREHLRFGSCLRKAVDDVGRPAALIASGDLSHRLQPDAPAGFNPTAYLFDEAVVAALQSNKAEGILDIDTSLRRLAGECGYRSILVGLGASKGLDAAAEVLSYEAPFGVGYLVAQLTSRIAQTRKANAPCTSQAAEEGDLSEILPALARRAVEVFTLTGAKIKPVLLEASILNSRAACFVSIKTKDGELRGCIGTIEPVTDCLGEELVTNAIAASTRDPRFPPVEPGELAELRYSVDILAAPSPAGMEDLDPRLWGVVVEDETGDRRGLLLPDIAGVDTAEQQVEIAAKKAGIPSGTPLRISRFRVDRFREKTRGVAET
jgi:AmmeMemoRadiSam system protein A/AmmeMemoRadiSam system protein B